MLNAEYNIMKTLNHENVIRIFDSSAYIDQDKNLITMMKMELAQQDFFQYLTKAPSFKKRREMLYHVACGLNYLHQQDIAHNDIKLENILIFYDYIAKIADFGYARRQSTIQNHSRRQQKQFWQSRNIINLSPEIKNLILENEEMIDENEIPFDELKVDVFSYGIMIVNAIFLFQLDYFNLISKDQKYDKIYNLYQNNVAKDCVDHLIDLINKCTTNKPFQRLSAQQIVNHPFFAECQNLQIQDK